MIRLTSKVTGIELTHRTPSTSLAASLPDYLAGPLAVSRYTSKQYDILNNNCNNFSEECAGFLLGKSIPSHILAAPEQLKESCLGEVAYWRSGVQSWRSGVVVKW